MMIPRKRNEFDLFRDFFEGDDLFPIKRESTIMKTDIKEKNDKYIIEMDLPGYDKENIQLSLKDGYLEVTAEVNKEENSDENEKFVHKERYYGHCSRSFYVGDQIKEDEISAEFKNGTLKICVPKKDEEKELPEARNIEIK
ncbi:MAG: Hsp20/alpha crystallin family protein [Clostridia bacterium]|nr:Hsp20/alpha crystallin family protein [Clostridia bacterium]